MSSPNTDTEIADESATDLSLRRNLYRAGLALFTLLAVVAVIQLYSSVNSIINIFIVNEYQPLFRAAFNLVVLLVSGIGISWSVSELSGE